MVVYEDKNWRTIWTTSAVIIQFNSVWSSKQRPNLSVSVSGSRLPKILFSPAINSERASLLVVMDFNILEEQDPENKTNNFRCSYLGSYSFLGPLGPL